MSKHYEAPAELRPLEKLLCEFAYNNGLDIRTVFDDLLTFIIHGMSPGAPPLTSWRYTQEQNKVFYRMYVEWIGVMDKMTTIKGWYDAFGELYMSLIVSPSQASQTGQFFTPHTICDLLQAITDVQDTKKDKLVGDPACGSGRTLLAFQAQHQGHYLIGEDIDQTCCKMAVCNFFIHGCVGEIIWHDALAPESYFGGWKINEHLYPHCQLGVRAITKEESVVWQMWQQRKTIPTITQPQQLSLWT
ncbi:N-6 DNA methylase [Bacteroides reticulotermitis]|uniref:N-6 DNA methylase n=1 Tax=Bacteroides reticulotermitis TaxID=1133319 RepID=UPI003A889A7C